MDRKICQILCNARVLAYVKGFGLVKFLVRNIELKCVNYGFFTPEGPEFFIEDKALYNSEFYNDVELEDVTRVGIYTEDVFPNIDKLKIEKVFDVSLEDIEF